MISPSLRLSARPQSDENWRLAKTKQSIKEKTKQQQKESIKDILWFLLNDTILRKKMSVGGYGEFSDAML